MVPEAGKRFELESPNIIMTYNAPSAVTSPLNMDIAQRKKDG